MPDIKKTQETSPFTVLAMLFASLVCLLGITLYIYVFGKDEYNISNGNTVASAMSSVVQDYRNAGGNLNSLDLTSFPAAYADHYQWAQSKRI